MSCCRAEQTLAPGRERKSGCEAQCCSHYSGSYGQLPDSWLVPPTRRSVDYISLYAIFPPPPPRDLPVPSYLDMDTIKGFLAPLHLNTDSIQDTLVRMFRSSPEKWSELFHLETSCQWRYGRGSAEGHSMGMERTYRLFVSSLEVIRLSKGQPLAFYLTAHFSQEDHPYDWQVRFVTFMCTHSRLRLGRLMHWLPKVWSA